MNGEGMPQVMDAWAGFFIMGYPAFPEQLPETLINRAVAQAARALVDEQRRVL